jgi:hypothetical protein
MSIHPPNRSEQERRLGVNFDAYGRKRHRQRHYVSAKQLPLALLAIVWFAGIADAETWYLMAADVKVISEPQCATKMSKGSMVGPVHFTAQGESNSRRECESDRRELIHNWRQHSIIARGGWAGHGITSPSSFAHCISSSDQRLLKPTPAVDAVAGPTMDILLHGKRRRF